MTKKVPQRRKGCVESGTDELRRMSTLLEVSRALADTLHLNETLQEMVQILEEHPSVAGASLTLLQEVSESLGFQSSQAGSLSGKKVIGRSVSGIVDKVIESNRPVVVPKVSQEPMLKRRFSSNSGEHSFVCVPLTLKSTRFGALAVELHYDQDRNYDRAVSFLRLVSSMVTQAVKISQLVEAEKKGLLAENIHLREELREKYDFSNIIGNSKAMRQVYEGITQVARTNTTVLIRGESGTGKELIAHAIHYNSLRSQKPFVRVSCAALPETLIETELFGHEKGAFTGAQEKKMGRFELAEGGTLFLDEIGELQPALQVKLLRVLQEREFERVGGIQTIKSNVRLIAATNRPIEEAIADGRFREDLYYRLNVFTVFVPPLRQRKSDILLLADHFLEKYSSEHGKWIRRISTPAIDMLVSYHWPGNVRELENTVERAVLVCDGRVIHGHHLPPTLQTAEASDTLVNTNLDEAVAAYERDLILDALKSTRGNRARAARLLGSTERIVGYKVKKYEIDCRRFR
jgi:Nif-specific regulatory protein